MVRFHCIIIVLMCIIRKDVFLKNIDTTKYTQANKKVYILWNLLQLNFSHDLELVLFTDTMRFGLVWLVGFLTSSSTTRLYRGRAPRQSVWQFYVLPHMRQSWETMTSVSAGHIILTSTQPVGSGRPQRESNPGPPHQESRALPTELPHPPTQCVKSLLLKRINKGIQL